MEIIEKVKILADAAKYDVSCASSGSKRENTSTGIGNAMACGICHSFTDDGRCVSLLKILMTNYCIYDCAYCINRRSNDLSRATFTVKEIVDLTINFYRRNYIEGLFLSSGVIKSPDYTMERLLNVAKELRTIHKYNGYIHLKAIPGASEHLIYEAGLYADRMSVNIEIPTEKQLMIVAPEKNFKNVLTPMTQIRDNIVSNKLERQKFKKAPLFTPAGQSTQMIIGATPEHDFEIMKLANSFYKEHNLKRVYYSGFLPVNEYDKRLPALTKPPLVRENRLYQTDWLMRFYNFEFDEIVNEQNPDLDLFIDPKLSYALRNYQLYPVDINAADYNMILRVPGIGVRSAKLIIQARRCGRLQLHHLKKMGIVLKRANYFITCTELPFRNSNLYPEQIKFKLLTPEKRKEVYDTQISIW
ncbi:MAG TPA: putative DNA modification/repair radical SAM protein [Bacteroidales bacterium]|nr:MAG: putative DNA modification/repair radical SAM protein [Bacteroidetes bacterium GWF2_33_38]OFY85883.1 MAG: putative DNA modification/repair radical SAM protein [Bacteroidetes bacterium RIFOXYA2_FULL_33_7]HBF87939.1 putative DNA modification/repair radical SAM protein [Bacteroidales bacterium]